MTFLPLTKTIHSQIKFPDCLLFFHSYLQVESSLTCPVGVTVAFREAQEIICSICCCTSTVSQYVTDPTQRLICCLWTANVMLDSRTIHIFASTREKGAHTARVQPCSAMAGEHVDVDMFCVEWRYICKLGFDVMSSRRRHFHFNEPLCSQKRKGIIM